MTKSIKHKLSFIPKFKYLLHSTREYKKYAYGSIIFVLLETALECVIPYIMSLLIEVLSSFINVTVTDALKEQALHSVLIYAAILLVLGALSLFCGVMSGRMSAIAATGLTKNLRVDIFKKITSYSFNNIDKFSTSSLITRQTTDIWNIQMAYMLLIRIAVRAPFMFVFSFVMALVVATPISWIFLITIPFIAIILICLIPIATKLFVKLFRKYDDLNELTEENIRGMRVVKTYAREEQQKEKFAHESGVMGKGFQKVEQIMSAVNPAMQAVMYLSMSLILFMGSILCIELGIEFGPENAPFNVGSLSAMITYSAQVLSSLMMVAMILFMIIMAVPAIERSYEVLTEEPTIKNPENPLFEVKNGDIDFENVSFKYKEDAEKYALANINLHIKSGQTVGIIGGTGSTKSTLDNLLSRFYDASVADVKVGGENVKNYDVKTLRDNVAMVLQKNVLFSGTINDNLKWGNKEATQEEIIEACKIAQADSFIETFPKKYDSWIEQGGVNVSGGQRQRLCIARALLKKPKVLILDDSTSAVDTKTDAFIRKGFKEFIPGITKIIIAQRISSVQDADMIIVMDNGEINGVGTHEELLKNNAIYQEVYEIQNRVGGAH